MRALEVVVLHEQPDPPLTIIEVREHRPGSELLPQRLPKPLDLPAGLRMVRPALDVPDSIPLELLLEVRAPAPRRVLPALVGQDLLRRTVVRNAARQCLHHQSALLVMRHHQAHHIPRVVIQERRHVHPLVLAQQEREQVRLPQLVRLGPLEAVRLGLGFGARWRSLGCETLRSQHPSHRRLRCADAEEPPHHVANLAATGLRRRRLGRNDRVMPRIPPAWHHALRLQPGRRLKPRCTVGPIHPRPLERRRVRHAEPCRHLSRRDLVILDRACHCDPHIQRPFAPPLVARAGGFRIVCSLHLSPPIGGQVLGG